MLHLRYSAGFWICFDFRIYQSSEYTGFLKMAGYTRFWIKCFVIDVWQYSEYVLDSEYSTVLNMLGSNKVVNKIFHHKYFTGFWICFEFWKHQFYTEFCRKQPVIHVWQVSDYSLGSQSYRAWIHIVVNMPRLHMVLHRLYFKDPHIILNILSSKYAKILNLSVV